jgi:hypothetical protein
MAMIEMTIPIVTVVIMICRRHRWKVAALKREKYMGFRTTIMVAEIDPLREASDAERAIGERGNRAGLWKVAEDVTDEGSSYSTSYADV